ncbi:unnamed protein product [Toxocara canis]|uniref:Alpha-1,6-mannosyl-glycoprotein 6-beta-N-acetylglucosaminyltransferase n=1 Tax=Toxocara canis TaxID=6265 RepID=A0A183U452_TOXCA|nr:unnamed protein product [Toxocara canis]
MLTCPLLRPTYRYLVLTVLLLFFLNLVLITHVADLHLYVQQLFEEVKWNSVRQTGGGAVRNARASYDCVVNDSLALSALSRMRTESCRQEARRLICALDHATPDTLPNTCPRYVESQRGVYVGCFTDMKSARVLTGHLYRLKQINSPQYCINLCLRAGYIYAGK